METDPHLMNEGLKEKEYGCGRRVWPYSTLQCYQNFVGSRLIYLLSFLGPYFDQRNADMFELYYPSQLSTNLV